jgi:hypothetical protein
MTGPPRYQPYAEASSSDWWGLEGVLAAAGAAHETRMEHEFSACIH